jgi:hypothetical protein
VSSALFFLVTRSRFLASLGMTGTFFEADLSPEEGPQARPHCICDQAVVVI